MQYSRPKISGAQYARPKKGGTQYAIGGGCHPYYSSSYSLHLLDGVFPSKCAWKRIIYQQTIQRSNTELFHECVESYPTCAPLILRSDGVSYIWTMTRHCQELSSICRRTMRIIGRVVMPKYRDTCLLCNRVNSDLVQHRILFCNAIDDCRKELWETIIELQGHSAFNRMRCSDLLTQCNYITCMLVNLNHDTFQNIKLV